MNRKSESEISRVLQDYGDMLYRTAYLLLGNPHDVQDALQETLLRYLEKAPRVLSLRTTKRRGCCGLRRTVVRIVFAFADDTPVWI